MKSQSNVKLSFEKAERLFPSPVPNQRHERAGRVKEMAWLRCRLDLGMFNDEVAVTYPTPGRGEWQTSVYVPSSCVRGESEHEGEVMVEVVFQRGNRCAILPNSEGDIVTPADEDLRQS